jgi:hypothetical protein
LVVGDNSGAFHEEEEQSEDATADCGLMYALGNCDRYHILMHGVMFSPRQNQKTPFVYVYKTWAAFPTHHLK